MFTQQSAFGISLFMACFLSSGSMIYPYAVIKENGGCLEMVPTPKLKIMQTACFA
jgi:hypothetical protein